MSNKHLKSEEFTPENIQAKIDKVGYLAGIDVEIDISYLGWLKVALLDAMCEVRIPTLRDVTTMSTA